MSYIPVFVHLWLCPRVARFMYREIYFICRILSDIWTLGAVLVAFLFFLDEIGQSMIYLCLFILQHQYSINDSPVSHPSQLTNPFLGLPLESGKCESCGTAEHGQCEGLMRAILVILCICCIRWMFSFCTFHYWLCAFVNIQVILGIYHWLHLYIILATSLNWEIY